MKRKAARADRTPIRNRVVVGCQNCRGDTRLPSCLRCQEHNIQCCRPLNVRLRHSSHVIDDDKTLLSFSKGQTWLRPPKTLRYHDETQELIQAYKDDSSADDEGAADNGRGAEHRLGDDPALDTFQNPDVIDSSDQVYGDPEYIEVHENHQSLEPYQSPGNESPLIESSPYTFTEREAYLMRNFIENMAQWVKANQTSQIPTLHLADVADLERHFEIEVPRRALHQPVLRLAIFAFSSRHVSRFSDYDETEALQYHTRCLQLLIPVLSAPGGAGAEVVTEDVLVTIAILRQYEEMDAYDKRCHLLGTTRILNSVSHFGSSGGLGEAAAWLCLREDIYVSLVSRQPLRTRLENYLNSRTFRRNDDDPVYPMTGGMMPTSSRSGGGGGGGWQQMNEEVEDWRRKLPSSFQPILFRPPCREQGRGLPEVWMLAPFHAVGIQYYHIAKIVLALYAHGSLTLGYESLLQARKAEKYVRSHLLIVLGLAASNRTAANTLFTARHALSALGGGCLRDKLDQDAAISFLMDMEKATGWKTAQLIQSLKDQWEDDSGRCPRP
ncbi:hypothetical protein VTN00DRAFT_6098 [Thermoascus crustaceus]|uniref:uncharacterized protein n=1 Tax=Thermoascus crustaceus TaxID=5088 RepID=UPI0037439037